jgi:coenzyme F420-0:L-glutamate ligase/coenzyme F420-1:gamma-L-glutamate ligase
MSDMHINKVEIIPIPLSIDIKYGDDIAYLILESIKSISLEILDNDVIVVAQKIVSKAEGRVVNLDSIEPSEEAERIAKEHGKDARLVELMLREGKIIAADNGVIITQTRHGFVCANAGIDASNVQGNNVTLLPLDADASARSIRDRIYTLTNKRVGVIITDTFGRPFREGQVNIAVGLAGINPIIDYRGKKDMYGKELRITQIAVADEIASAAELVMGKSKGVPVALVRGLDCCCSNDDHSIHKLIRSEDKDKLVYASYLITATSLLEIFSNNSILDNTLPKGLNLIPLTSFKNIHIELFDTMKPISPLLNESFCFSAPIESPVSMYMNLSLNL